MSQTPSPFMASEFSALVGPKPVVILCRLGVLDRVLDRDATSRPSLRSGRHCERKVAVCHAATTGRLADVHIAMEDEPEALEFITERECALLSDETRLPRELVVRFGEMWSGREPPHFKKVSDEGTLSQDDLAELVRSLKVTSPLLCRSIARVIGDGAAASFAQFVRGYAGIHSRTLKEALPFAFKVFDLDGDGRLKQEEFTAVLDETMAMANLDGAQLRKVLKAPRAEDEKVEGISFDSFRYFSSLSSQTILACCGFMLHVQDFYVPLVPFGSAEEEAQEEAAEKRRQLREVRFAAA